MDVQQHASTEEEKQILESAKEPDRIVLGERPSEALHQPAPALRSIEPKQRMGLLGVALFPNALVLAAMIFESFVAGFAAVFAIFLALALYGSLALRNEQLNPKSRAMWVASLFLVGPIAAPLYWYNYVRKEAVEKQGPAHGSTPRGDG